MTIRSGEPTLQGTFASVGQRRLERRWQQAGVAALTAFTVAALCGLVGDRGTVLRAAGVYVFLLAVFRVAGRRTLAQVTTFDLILVLIIGDATQQAIIGDDFTMTAGILAVSTLLVMDVALSKAKHRWPRIDAVVEGLPLPLVKAGKPLREYMDGEGISEDDLLEAARGARGLSRLDQIGDAVLEASGGISVLAARPDNKTPPTTS